MTDQHLFHKYIVRVFYEDTDSGGIVYYANYLKFMERARTELLRQLGLTHGELMRKYGLRFAVKECKINYIKPAVLDDELSIISEIVRLRGASLEINQDVLRDQVCLVSGNIRLALLNAEGSPSRFPSALKILLQQSKIKKGAA
tara:strand:+ start:30555 stop:30986 length:432 start_codon:yes stop_codon:yes gene_type:complete